jgi:tetratricopeptide (TPR) repeat protein
MISVGRRGCIGGSIVAATLVSFLVSAPAAGREKDDLAALNWQVVQLHQAGKYAEAIPLAQSMLALAERLRGPDHPDVGTSLNSLAGLYEFRGRYAEAESLYKRSLSIREKALGPEHPDVGNSLNNLAGLYESQGRYAEAEPLYKRSLAIREKSFGPEHPIVGNSLNNLAVLYGFQGR